MATEKRDAKDGFVIHIDHVQFRVPSSTLTGQQLRALPTTPIGPDRDLFLEESGKAEDRLIGDAEPVTIKNGLQFYTGPSRINPG